MSRGDVSKGATVWFKVDVISIDAVPFFICAFDVEINSKGDV